MRISEILLYDKKPAEANRSNSELDLRPTPFSDDPANLATAFTKDGRVKHLWNQKGCGAQPSGPAPLDAEPELILSGGTLEPSTVERGAVTGSASSRPFPARPRGITRPTSPTL